MQTRPLFPWNATQSGCLALDNVCGRSEEKENVLCTKDSYREGDGKFCDIIFKI